MRHNYEIGQQVRFKYQDKFYTGVMATNSEINYVVVKAKVNNSVRNKLIVVHKKCVRLLTK